MHSLLYENSDVTVLESYLLAFQYSVKHKLSKIALSELLQLIKVHLPQPTPYPTSVYQMKAFFMELFPYCLAALPINGVCGTLNCPGTGQSQVNHSFSLSLSLAPQLKRIMEGG